MGEDVKREDFVATIGFQGNTAYVDSKVRKRYGKLTGSELLDRGLYRTAFCAALYDDDSATVERLLEHFRAGKDGEHTSIRDLKKMFGVDAVPDGVAHVKAL